MLIKGTQRLATCRHMWKLLTGIKCGDFGSIGGFCLICNRQINSAPNIPDTCTVTYICLINACIALFPGPLLLILKNEKHKDRIHVFLDLNSVYKRAWERSRLTKLLLTFPLRMLLAIISRNILCLCDSREYLPIPRSVNLKQAVRKGEKKRFGMISCVHIQSTHTHTHTQCPHTATCTVI